MGARDEKGNEMQNILSRVRIPHVLIAVAIIAALVVLFGVETVQGWIEALYRDATADE